MDSPVSLGSNDDLDRLRAEHDRYAQRIETLQAQPYLSADEQLEEVRLNKLKLHAKDLIQALEHSAQPGRSGAKERNLSSKGDSIAANC